MDVGGQDPPSAEADCEGEGACAGGALCDVYNCGGRPARFNHFGCARVPCETDEACPVGEACFALAYDRICEPSSTRCFEEDEACVCEATDDCGGSLDAHCLPTEFYPPSDYCRVDAFDCDTLGDWAAALRGAAQAKPALAPALEACAESADVALAECP